MLSVGHSACKTDTLPWSYRTSLCEVCIACITSNALATLPLECGEPVVGKNSFGVPYLLRVKLGVCARARCNLIIKWSSDQWVAPCSEAGTVNLFLSLCQPLLFSFPVSDIPVLVLIRDEQICVLGLQLSELSRPTNRTWVQQHPPALALHYVLYGSSA